MLDELRQIDVSAIAELVRVKQEEELLGARLSKMETSKPKVSEVVYDRVRKDYQSRQAALDVQSRPLKERARREYARLRALRAEVERTLEAATLDKEELEFRRDLGEFPGDEFSAKLAESETVLAGKRQELAEIDQLKQQFVNAFHTEAELETPPEVTIPASPRAPEPAGERTAVSSAEMLAEESDESEESEDSTHVSVPEVGPTTIADAARPQPPPDANIGATAQIAIPRIVKLIDNKPGDEIALPHGTTTIGRSPKNQICLPYSEVSRHHANIVFTADGYRIVDLDSGNGILVNGKRVTEHILAEGDVIQIGMQKLVYRV